MTTTPPVRAISFGGGQQSMALLVLAAQGRINYRTFLFANVGDDSELPGTLRYVEEYARPFAAEHSLELVELRRIMQRGPDKGRERTLLQQLNRDSRTIDIPVRMANGAPGNRACTADYKIKLIGSELARRGATIHLRRTDCQRIIAAAGLPIPPKSACWFCPMKRPEDWHNQRRTEPELFEQSCQLEDRLNERRDQIGKDHVYLTRFGQPLREAIPDGVDLLPMFDEAEGACDSGYCMT